MDSADVMTKRLTFNHDVVKWMGKIAAILGERFVFYRKAKIRATV
jgi:hypothetical protein